MDGSASFAPTLLLAMPQLRDPNFVRSVVLLCEHGAQGALGFVVNRPTEVRAVDAVVLDPPASGDSGLMLWAGGPVESQRGFLLLGDHAGVTVEVETEHDDLARSLAAQFPDGAAARGTPDTTVRVRWTEGPRPTLTPEAVFPGWPADVLVHRHVWTAPGRLLCLQCDDAS